MRTVQKIFVPLCLLSQFCSIALSKQDKCYGLALSDSVDLGPYQAGVISQYIQLNAQNNVTYNTVSGVGIGAINAYLYSLYPQGSEARASQEMKEFWSQISKQSHFQKRAESFMYGLFFEDSLYDSSNMNQILQKNIKNQTHVRGLDIGITNVLTGLFKAFNENTSYSDMIKVLQASITYVGISPLVDAFQALWFTGSTVYEVDINSIILKCKQQGYSENDTVVDVVLSAYPMIKHEAANLYNGFQNLARTIILQTRYEKLYGVIRTKQSHPDVQIRYIAGPTEEVASKHFPFDYNQAEIDYLFNLGIQDAKWAVKNLEKINESLSPIFYNQYQSKQEIDSRKSSHLTSQQSDQNLKEISNKFLQDEQV